MQQLRNASPKTKIARIELTRANSAAMQDLSKKPSQQAEAYSIADQASATTSTKA